jgi:hypothetical protein
MMSDLKNANMWSIKNVGRLYTLYDSITKAKSQLNFCPVPKVTWQNMSVWLPRDPNWTRPPHTPNPCTAFFRLVLTQASREKEQSIITLINNWGKANDLPDTVGKTIYTKTSLGKLLDGVSKSASGQDTETSLLGWNYVPTVIFSPTEYTVLLLFGRRRGICLVYCCRSVMAYLEPTKFPT